MSASMLDLQMCDTSACGPDCADNLCDTVKMEHRFDAEHKLVSTQTLHKYHTFAGAQSVSKLPVMPDACPFESHLKPDDALSATCPKLQLVIARYQEDVAWLNNVSDDIEIVIYNKGKKDILPKLLRKVTVIDVANLGRESETYCRHMIQNYHNLAEYTIFSQGDPFCHAPYLMEFLKDPTSMSAIQMMSLKYLNNIPPQFLLDKARDHPWMRLERMSTRTLDSVLFRDAGTEHFYNAYLKHNNLSPGVNIIKHFFDDIGLPHAMSEETEVCNFAYGAIFGVSKPLIQKHSVDVYSAMRTRSVESWENGYIIERIWFLLFSPTDARR